MNDETKELLELAAKAMGFKPAIEGLVAPANFYIWVDDNGVALRKNWNPLTNADDLVEMECQMDVEPRFRYHHATSAAQAIHYPKDCSQETCATELIENHNNSRRAARAMASLRIAAEIGRRME